MPAPERYIRLSGSYATADLDRLLSALAPLNAMTEAAVVSVDLRELERISAPSVAVLVSTLLDVAARGLVLAGSRIVAPRKQEIQQRLEKLDVLELLVDRPRDERFVRRQDRGSRPCQRFTVADEPGLVAQSLTDAVAEVCPTDLPARHAMWWALNEIAQNVVDHSDALGGGVGIAEVTRGGAELEVAIADHGVGIRASLSRNPLFNDVASDLSALEKALEPDTTGRPNKPGGRGLYLTKILLRENGGGLVMRSGTAQLEVGAVPSAVFDGVPLQGTLVTLRFRTDRSFRLDPIILAPP